MCFPIPSDDLRIRGTTQQAGPVSTGRGGTGDTLDGPEEGGRGVTEGEVIDEGEDEETARRRQQLKDMGSIFDAFDRGATSAFAVLGPRLGVQSISDVRPGEQGRQTSITDIKAAV